MVNTEIKNQIESNLNSVYSSLLDVVDQVKSETQQNSENCRIILNQYVQEYNEIANLVYKIDKLLEYFEDGDVPEELEELDEDEILKRLNDLELRVVNLELRSNQ